MFHLLIQGIQRRFIITLSYESGNDIQWAKVTELVVGMYNSIHHTALLRSKAYYYTYKTDTYIVTYAEDLYLIVYVQYWVTANKFLLLLQEEYGLQHSRLQEVTTHMHCHWMLSVHTYLKEKMMRGNFYYYHPFE